MTLRVLGVLLMTAGGALASPSPGASLRTVTASTRTLGCAPALALPCEGVTSTRLGNLVAELAWRRADGRGLFTVVHAAAAPARRGEVELASQVIAAAGYEQRLGARTWLRAGAGLAAARVGLGPRTIRTGQILAAAVPAAVVGAGTLVALPRVGVVEVALDAGAALVAAREDRVYQVTASLSRRL